MKVITSQMEPEGFRPIEVSVQLQDHEECEQFAALLRIAASVTHNSVRYANIRAMARALRAALDAEVSKQRPAAPAAAEW